MWVISVIEKGFWSNSSGVSLEPSSAVIEITTSVVRLEPIPSHSTLLFSEFSQDCTLPISYLLIRVCMTAEQLYFR